MCYPLPTAPQVRGFRLRTAPFYSLHAGWIGPEADSRRGAEPLQEQGRPMWDRGGQLGVLEGQLPLRLPTPCYCSSCQSWPGPSLSPSHKNAG